MPRPRKLTDTTIQQAALLHSRGMPQRTIEKRLGLSQSSVSRALHLARRDAWLVDRPYLIMDRARIQELEALTGKDVREAKRVLAYEATAIAHGAVDFLAFVEVAHEASQRIGAERILHDPRQLLAW